MEWAIAGIAETKLFKGEDGTPDSAHACAHVRNRAGGLPVMDDDNPPQPSNILANQLAGAAIIVVVRKKP